MLLDLDYFYAQCEERRNPALRGKAVVVGVYSGRTAESGAVATANYLARASGVKSGMPLSLARAKLRGRDAVFLPMDRDYYRSVSDSAMRILRDHADTLEQVSIDEAYLDVSLSSGGSFEAAEAMAREIKYRIRAQERLTCSIGIGPNKLIAKIAADRAKPDGLTVVRPEEVTTFLSPLPVGSIPGVGAKTEERMNVMGITTIADLAAYDPQLLIRGFGRKLGAYFHSAALGEYGEPVAGRGEPDSISRIATLKENTRDPQALKGMVERLCREVHGRAVSGGYAFRSIGLIVILEDLAIHSRSRTLESPTADLQVLIRTAGDLVDKFLSESDQRVRRLGVRVSGLDRQKAQTQLSSFL